MIAGDDVTQAFPGTACPSAWSTGCTTTMTIPAAAANMPDQTHTQTWCCPSSYACWTGGWETSWTGGITPTRICTSQATMRSPSGRGAASPVRLWVPANRTTYQLIELTSSAAVAGTDNGEPGTDGVIPSSSSATLPNIVTIFHPVFPLQRQESEDPDGGPQRLRLGVGIGVPLAVLLVLGPGAYCLMRWWQIKRQTQGPETVASDNNNDTAELNGGEMVAVATHGFDGKPELPAIALSELSGLSIPLELLGDHGAVEIGDQPHTGELPGENEEHAKKTRDLTVDLSTRRTEANGGTEGMAELP